MPLQVTKVCVTSMVGRTYHARIHYATCPGQVCCRIPLPCDLQVEAPSIPCLACALTRMLSTGMNVHFSTCLMPPLLLFEQGPTGLPVRGEVSIDARPSDAINLAVRFGAPIYVDRQVPGLPCIPALSHSLSTFRLDVLSASALRFCISNTASQSYFAS